MERQTNQLVRLVDDLLDVSRITQDKIELRTELVDASRGRPQCGGNEPPDDRRRRATNWRWSLPPEPLTLKADPVRLAQVIANLLNNAAKYTPEGGQIWLTAAADEGEAVISVRDNGVGIAPEMLSHVFDKFAQVGGAQGHFGGLGIGLTLARSLVDLHGGRLEALERRNRQGQPVHGSPSAGRRAVADEIGSAAPAITATRPARQRSGRRRRARLGVHPRQAAGGDRAAGGRRQGRFCSLGVGRP